MSVWPPIEIHFFIFFNAFLLFVINYDLTVS